MNHGSRLQIAKRQAVVNPENTFFSVKRFIGRKMEEVKDESKQVPYQVSPSSLAHPSAGQATVTCSPAKGCSSKSWSKPGADMHSTSMWDYKRDSCLSRCSKAAGVWQAITAQSQLSGTQPCAPEPYAALALKQRSMLCTTLAH
jgi:hypothetical protein